MGSTGTLQNYAHGGWCTPERDYAWTDGKKANLVFDVPASERGLKFRMHLAAHLSSPTLMSQSVEVYANGSKVADWEVTQRGDYEAFIPAEIVAAAGGLLIQLKLPKAASPQSLGASADTRALGVSCWELQLSEI